MNASYVLPSLVPPDRPSPLAARPSPLAARPRRAVHRESRQARQFLLEAHRGLSTAARAALHDTYTCADGYADLTIGFVSADPLPHPAQAAHTCIAPAVRRMWLAAI
jgi:hypothetical protein